MAFGIGIHKPHTDTGTLRGTRIDIACEAWFTSTGRVYPLMFKFQDELGRLHTVRDIRVHTVSEQRYAGVFSLEYDCTITLEGLPFPAKLVFFKEECRWIMSTRLPDLCNGGSVMSVSHESTPVPPP